jgi:hypothetical protein
MKADRKDSRSSALERINLRLCPEVLEAIDAECSRRAGSVCCYFRATLGLPKP